jgi:hypothetical protein
MTTIVLCPRGHTVTLDEPLRRAIACPRCGVVFSTCADADSVLPPGALAARSERRPSRDEDADEDDDRPRRRKRRDDDDEDDDKVRGGPPKRKPLPRRKEEEEDEEEEDEEPDKPEVELTRKQKQMALVRLGVLFHIIKLWVYLASALFGIITLPLVIFAAIAIGGIVGQLLMQTTFNLAMTIAPILGIVGSILCARVPPRSEARGIIIVSMIFDALAPFFGVFQLIMFFAYHGTGDDRVRSLMNYMLLARLACTLVAWWLFQLYLRKVSFYMRETLLASESLNVIVHLLMATVITPTLVVAQFFVLFMGFGGLFVLILFLATVGWTIFIGITFPIRQFRLLFKIRQKIFEKYLKVDDD